MSKITLYHNHATFFSSLHPGPLKTKENRL